MTVFIAHHVPRQTALADGSLVWDGDVEASLEQHRGSSLRITGLNAFRSNANATAVTKLLEWCKVGGWSVTFSRSHMSTAGLLTILTYISRSLQAGESDWKQLSFGFTPQIEEVSQPGLAQILRQLIQARRVQGSPCQSLPLLPSPTVGQCLAPLIV